jgi:acyl-CoA thioester hydrolase
VAVGDPVAQPFTHPIRVRFAECDPQGVVFNAHYLAYFDIAMTELWRAAFGSYQSMVERGFDMVVAEARLGFAAPARFDDELELRVAVTKLGNTSIVTKHGVWRDGIRLVEGDMRHVVVELPGLRKASMPEWIRDGLAPWVVAPVAQGH